MNSVLMTVRNRPPEVLEKTLLALFANDLSDSEIVVLDDCSSVDYGPMLTRLASNAAFQRLRWEKYDRANVPADAYVLADGSMDPACAFNEVARRANGERLILMSSDVLAPPGIIARLRTFDLAAAAYHAATMNSNGTVFCGRARIAPLGWFLALTADMFKKLGGYDEGFMGGISCEDTDFSARLFEACGSLVIDQKHVCTHQDHPDVSYSDGGKGCGINFDYLATKWAEHPWRKHIPLRTVTIEGDLLVLRSMTFIAEQVRSHSVIA